MSQSDENRIENISQVFIPYLHWKNKIILDFHDQNIYDVVFTSIVE